MKNADMPAMPVIDSDGGPRTGRSFEKDYIEQLQPMLGLTKREMMAMNALQGLLAAPDLNTAEPRAVALTAIAYSDALLAELERTKGESK